MMPCADIEENQTKMTETRKPLETYRGFDVYELGTGDLEIGGEPVARLFWARAAWDPSTQLSAPTRMQLRRKIYDWWEAP
jgi:hypothetical protein